jgi:hypothetical protein
MGTYAPRTVAAALAALVILAPRALAASSSSGTAGTIEAAQPVRPVPPPPAGDGAPGRWLDLQAGTLGLVARRIDDGAGLHTLDALQWAPTVRGRVRFDAASRYTLDFGLQGGQTFKFSWNGTGVGSQDFFAAIPLRHLYLGAVPVRGVALQVGSMPLLRGESSEITTWDNDGYVLGERVVVARRDRLWFDEVGVTNAYLGDWWAPSLFDRLDRADERNYRQVVATRTISARLSFSVEYTAHNGTRTLRQGVAVRAPSHAFFDLVRIEQYQRVKPSRDVGMAVSVEKAVMSKVRISGGFATVDPHFSSWNGDRFNVGDHLFASVTAPLFGYVSFSAFVGRELHAAPTSANLNRFDVGVMYDALAHWQASRRR